LAQDAALSVSTLLGIGKPWQDFQSSDVPAINLRLKSAGLAELHLEAAIPASSQANGNDE
jgi:hypothetical protein